MCPGQLISGGLSEMVPGGYVVEDFFLQTPWTSLLWEK